MGSARKDFTHFSSFPLPNFFPCKHTASQQTSAKQDKPNNSTLALEEQSHLIYIQLFWLSQQRSSWSTTQKSSIPSPKDMHLSKNIKNPAVLNLKKKGSKIWYDQKINMYSDWII